MVDPADFEMEFVDPEPVVAPEPGVAPNTALEHDPVHADAPAVAPWLIICLDERKFGVTVQDNLLLRGPT